MRTKRASKTLSLFLTFCMVFTMLSTAAFAETVDVNSGVPLGVSGIITNFAPMDEDVAVSGWASDPAYDGNTAGDYVFTPTLNLVDGLILAEGITPSAITVTVTETAAPQVRGGVAPLAVGDITDQFTDPNFLAAVRTALGKDASAPIYDTDVASVTELLVILENIESLAGIEHFTALTKLDCSANVLTTIPALPTGLKYLYCDSNELTMLPALPTGLIYLRCNNNRLTSLPALPTSLTDLNCSANRLAALDLSGLGSLAYCNANSQKISLTLTGSGSSYTTAITLNNPTDLASGLSYAGGVLSSNSKAITTSSFTVDTGNADHELSGTLNLTYQGDISIEITGFEAVSNMNAGTAGSATYANASEVIAILPTSVTATHANGNTPWTVSTWVDTDGYNPTAAGSYTFTAILGTAPTGYTNSGGHTATVEVVVSAPPTGTVTGRMYIDGTPYVDLRYNQSGKGWVWTAATATLVLESSYGGSNIHIPCAPDDTINLAYIGDVTITGTSTIASAFFCNGNLKINGSGGTLTVNYTGNNPMYCALDIQNALTIQSGTVNAISAAISDPSAYSTVIFSGSILSISDSANVTAAAMGTESCGIWAIQEMYIDTTGSVTANGKGTGYALVVLGEKPIAITKGTVNLSNSDNPANLYCGKLNHIGGTINGKPPTPTTPTITAVTAPIALTYAADHLLNFTVTFSEPVSVVGTPRIAMTVGTETKYAIYTGNTDENRLNFQYVVQDTDVDSDGIVLSSQIDLNGAEIKNAAGIDAVLTFVPPNTSDILVDGVTPVIYTIRGTIKGNDTNVGIENADIIINTPGGIPYFSASTNSDGEYSSRPLTAGTYSMEVSALGYDTVTVSNIVISGADAVRDLTLIKTGSTTPTITITKHPQNVTVTQGRINETLTAEAVASNGKPVRYQWRRFIGGIGSDNTQPMLGETSNTFTIPTGLTAGTYRYLCVFNTDGTDYVDSNTATVTVKPSYSDGSGGGSGGESGGSSGGNGGSSVVVTPTAPDAPNAPTQGSVNIPGAVDASGNVTANITNQTVSDAIDKVLAQARQNGTEQNGIILTLNIITGGKPVNNFSANLPKEVQDAIIAKGVSGLIITAGGSDMAIGMDLAALREMNRQARGNINLTATRMNNAALAGDARAAIGNRPVFDLKANYDNDRTVQNFGAGSVSVSIPYTLSANENAGNIQAVYVDANGKVQWLISSVYDSVNKVLRFSTNHFSTYGVGYKQDAQSLTDISTHWAREDIEFVVNRGLLGGTSATTFSPNTAMTRGMFVTALGRLANADVGGYKNSSFTDVKSDTYYMGYVEWANKNNIVKGIGDEKFAPDQSITREQMAVILQSYTKAIGFTLRKVHAENTFADNANISSYAKEAVKQMQMAGIISGKSGNLFDPQGTATRAEVSVVLSRFVELERLNNKSRFDLIHPGDVLGVPEK